MKQLCDFSNDKIRCFFLIIGNKNELIYDKKQWEYNSINNKYIY